jgi:hypothetical protein
VARAEFKQSEDDGGGTIVVGRSGLQFAAEFAGEFFDGTCLFELLQEPVEGGSRTRLAAK